MIMRKSGVADVCEDSRLANHMYCPHKRNKGDSKTPKCVVLRYGQQGLVVGRNIHEYHNHVVVLSSLLLPNLKLPLSSNRIAPLQRQHHYYTTLLTPCFEQRMLSFLQ